MFGLQPPRHISTLPFASSQDARHVGFSPIVLQNYFWCQNQQH
jgi:hypothetical protein